MPRPVLIDTDAGVDDALALILALRSPEIAIRAITTVAGNARVQHCTRNVLAILDLLNIREEIVVAEGAARPLRRPLTTAPEVHGSDGLGNARPSALRSHVKSRQTAARVIGDCCERFPGLTLVALGPLTNIAQVIRKRPGALRNMRRLITMGGAFRVAGNTGPVAEFNYYVDPEAAQVVMESGIPLTIVPLDLTQQIVLMRKELESRARRRANDVSRSILDFTRGYMKYHRQTENFLGGYLHDPLAIACALRPSLFRTRRLTVKIETRGTLTRGMSVADFRNRSKNGQVDVAFHVDRERFLTLFHERLWA